MRPGFEADQILLEADPLADIRNSRRIAAVLRAGRLLDARQIAELRKASVEPG